VLAQNRKEEIPIEGLSGIGNFKNRDTGDSKRL
jgi:hypothetical protein